MSAGKRAAVKIIMIVAMAAIVFFVSSYLGWASAPR